MCGHSSQYYDTFNEEYVFIFLDPKCASMRDKTMKTAVIPLDACHSVHCIKNADIMCFLTVAQYNKDINCREG